MKMKMTKSQALQIHFEAKTAAREAAAFKSNAYRRDNPNCPYGEPIAQCGFAWVWIESGRGTFAKSLREAGEASKHYSGRGLHVHSPAEYRGQCVDMHGAGAMAYANVLNQYGINARAQYRMD